MSKKRIPACFFLFQFFMSNETSFGYRRIPIRVLHFNGYICTYSEYNLLDFLRILSIADRQVKS